MSKATEYACECRAVPMSKRLAEWREIAGGYATKRFPKCTHGNIREALREAADVCEGLMSMLAVREARISALEAERDDVARRLIEMEASK